MANRFVSFRSGPRAYITPGGQVFGPYDMLSKCDHLLIAGATGSGKSVVLNGIIYAILAQSSPAKARFILVDPKQVELFDYKAIPHTVQYASNRNDIISALENAVTMTENRFRTMQASGTKLYNGPDLYVIIDELADLMVSIRKETLPLLQRLAQIGRAARVHLIACSQNVMAQTIPTVLRCNFNSILGLRTATKSQSRYLIAETGCELLPDPKKAGTSFGYFRSGADLEKIEFYMYPDSDIRRLVSWWASSACIAG